MRLLGVMICGDRKKVSRIVGRYRLLAGPVATRKGREPWPSEAPSS
jgi:hypothetical protein